MNFQYLPAASALHDASALSAALAPFEGALAAIGGGRVDSLPSPSTGTLFHFALTGGVEAAILRRHHSLVQQGRGGPLLLIAHPAHNSLPAALEILARVRQEGGDGRVYLLRGPDDQETLADLTRTARAMDAVRRLAEDRIGCIGAPSEWLVASSQRAESVATRFGTKLLELPVEELRAHIARAADTPEGPESAVWDHATARDGVLRQTFSRATEVYRALKDLVHAHRLAAVTVRCFDLVTQDGTTGCLALSLLADEGIAAGCEGDIPSILLLRWIWHLTGKPGWMANPSDVDSASGSILLAHCTIPLSLVESWSLKSHFESGLGVAIDGTWPTGPVTLLRLGGADLKEWWGAEGECLESLHAPNLCRTQIRVRLAPSDAAQLLRSPLGNHLVVVPGHVKALFAESFLHATPRA